jgi:hypothetical protein
VNAGKRGPIGGALPTDFCFVARSFELVMGLLSCSRPNDLPGSAAALFVGSDETETEPAQPLSLAERQRRIELDMAALARVQMLAGSPSSAPPPRPSLPVRAGIGTYRLTRQAMTVLGLLAAIAEIFSRAAGIDYGPFAAIARAIVERAPENAQEP